MFFFHVGDFAGEFPAWVPACCTEEVIEDEAGVERSRKPMGWKIHWVPLRPAMEEPYF